MARTLEPKPLQVPKLAWPDFLARFRRRFNQGDHVTCLGGPGCGKTHLSIFVAEQRAYSLFLATKPRDPLIGRLYERGWTISSSLEPMEQMVEVLDRKGKPVKNPDGSTQLRPLYPRLVYWPQPLPSERGTLEQDAEFKRGAVQAALIELKRQGSWALVMDELNYATEVLRLRRELSELYHTARSNRVSVIGSAQRPSWIPRAALDNPGFFFIFHASDQQELKRLGEITGGLDWRPLAEEIQTLNFKRHEFLFVSTRDRFLARSIAPAW